MAEEHHEPSGVTSGSSAGDAGWSNTNSWAAGWYPDPWNPGAQRYWSGESWTTQVYGADGIVRSHPIAGLPDPPVDPARAGGSKTHGPEWIPPPWPQLTTPTATVEPPTPPNRRQLTVAVVAALVAAGLVIGFAVGFLATGGKSHADPPFSASPFTPPPTLPPATLPPSLTPGSTTPGSTGPGATTPGSTTPGSTTPGAGTPGSTAPGSTPTQPADPDAAILANLGLRQADAPAGSTVTLIPMGDQVTGTTTLDVCNANYPSESLRTARRQVALVGPTLVTDMSSEAVLYRNPAAAAQAFAELKRAAAHCPPTPVTSPVGEPTITTTFEAAPDKTWPQVPGVSRLAFSFDTTDELGNTSNVVAVYLHKGRVLLALYFDNGPTVSEPVAGASTLPGIVRVFEQRVTAVPAGVANRG